MFIEPGSPRGNGKLKSFNINLRDELLKRKVFYSLEEVKLLVEHWRQQYSHRQPHSSLGNMPPAPEVY